MIPITKQRLLLCGTALVMIALGTVAQPAEQPVWKTIEEVFRAERILVPSRSDQKTRRLPEEHPYFFETFATLEAQHFLNGLTFVLQKYPVPTEPASLPGYTRDMGYKLRLLFEYYPLAARGGDDFTALINLILDSGTREFLRVFLLRHTAPGLEPRSSFGSYMAGHMAHGGEDFEKRLMELIQLPQESVAVQTTALDVLLTRVEHDYAALLAGDSVVSANALGVSVHVRQLIDAPDAIPMSRRTQILLERKHGAVGAWAKTLYGTANNAQRNSVLRAKAREALEVVLREYPIPNRDELQGK